MSSQAHTLSALGLTLAAVLALALLCGLGVWQVQRMQWKNGLIDQAEAAEAHQVRMRARRRQVAPVPDHRRTAPGSGRQHGESSVRPAISLGPRTAVA